jgi:hypothetical protein
MFASQSIDYSLSTPTRCLASLPSRSSSAKAPSSSPADENEDGWGDDDSFKFDDALNENTHRFLVGTAHPSISKPDTNDVSDDEENNQLHVLSYHEDSHEITLDASYPHPNGEVWAMAPHPKNETVVTCGGGVYLVGEDTASSSGSKLMEFKTTLWKMSNGDDEDFGLSSGPTLETLITIPHGENHAVQTGWERRVGCILWSPLLLSSDDSFDEQDVSASLLTVGWDASSPISLWDLSASCAVETWSCSHSTGSSSRGRKRYNLQSALPRRASWDPHEPTNILCTENQDVIAFDMRSAASADGIGAIQNAHRYGIASVDHNRLQDHVVVTSGMDGVVKFWDLRMHLSSRDGSCLPPAKLLKTVRGGHSHWITRASYNPFYDQLVLSGGTDGIANLWRVSSCSSAPLLDFADDDDVNNSAEDANDGDEDEGDGNWAVEQEAGSPTDPTDDAQRGEEKKDVTSVKPSSNDTRVSRYECTDTTADVCWSASDPWMYASLACDGTLAVHHVPSKEKYKILL